jgi:hypothetical protein
MVSERRSGGICQLIDTGRNRPCLLKFLTGQVTVVVLLGLIVAFVGGRKHIPTPLEESSIPTSEKSTKLKQFLIHLGYSIAHLNAISSSPSSSNLSPYGRFYGLHRRDWSVISIRTFR